ncbi:MAG TPA: hypothetical protein VMZ25_08950 [Terriglobales bacterium]|nr:hypothetical protein [Terriglobales bacterium]
MYSGNIIDELVRSVEVAEEHHLVTSPVQGVRQHYPGTGEHAARAYEFLYTECSVEVA